MNQQVLASLAILKTNWDAKQGSFLDNFQPFVADCLRDAPKGRTDEHGLCASLAERFGIQLPVEVVQTLLHAAAKRGLGERRDGEFFVDPEAVGEENLTPIRQETLRKQAALVAKLTSYARDEFQLEWTAEHAEEELLQYVARNGPTVLQSSLRGAPFEASLGMDREAEFVIGSFVLHLFERDPEGFDYLDAVVRGSMLAAALYLPFPAEAGRKFSGTTIYLDTPVLLSALGYEGESARLSATETLDLAYESGALLAAFTDTISETRGVLLAISASMRRRGGSANPSRSVEAHFAAEGLTPSDVQLLAEKLEHNVRSMRITIKDRPAPRKELTVDEAALEAELLEVVGYPAREAMLHDLDALTAVYRIRSGRPYERVEDCRALFVTKNFPMIQVARQFFATGSTIPLAMSVRDFTTLVWLKRPLSAPDLPMRQVIADAYAALEPGNALWTRYLQEIDRLQSAGNISETDYTLLRYSLDAQRALMRETRGTVEAVDEVNIKQVLEETKASLTKPVAEQVERLRGKSAATEEEHGRQIAHLREELARVAAASAAKDAHNTQLASKLDDLITRPQRAIQARASRRARLLVTTLRWTLVALAVAAVVPWIVPQAGTVWKVVGGVAVAVAVYVTVAPFFSDSTPARHLRQIEVWLSRRLELRYREHAGLEPLEGN